MNKSKNILFLIILAGLVLRLLGLTNINLGGDFEYHWSVAGSIARGENYPLLGPGASISEDFHLGPFYYYLLSIPYILGGEDYRVAIIFFSVVNSATIFLLYKLVSEWFDEKNSLRISALFAFSSFMITTGNFPWNAYLIPFLVILSLYLLMKLRQGRSFYLLALISVVALGLQSHATFAFLVPLILLNIPYKKIKPGQAIISLFLIMIILSPWLYTEIEGGFDQTRHLASVVFAQDEQICNFREWLVNHGHGERCFHYFRNTLFIFRLFSMSIFASTDIFVVALTSLLSLYTLLTSRQYVRRFFVSWLFSVFFLYLFYSANIYLHYMLILIPLPFMIFVMFLDKLRDNKGGRLFADIVFILVIISNILHYIISLSITRT